MNILIKTSDFEIICRICLQTKNQMFKITTKQILEMLEECTPVLESKKMKLPKQLCNDCYKTLKVVFEFRKLWIQSREILYSLVDTTEDSKNDIKSEPLENANENSELFFPNNEIENFKLDDTKVSIEKSEIKISDIEENDSKITKSDDEYGYEEDTHEDLDDNTCSSEDLIKNENNSKIEEENQIQYERKQRSLADILLKKYKIYGLTCNICNKEISTRSTLLRHMEIHDKNRRLNYTCHICNKGFYAQENLNKHINRHMGKTKLQCDLCPKRFYVLSALGVHYKSSHKVDPKQCSRCDQSFYHPLQLEQHEQTHNEKKLICDVCGKVFTRKNKLTRHKKNHTQERPYLCNICNKNFKTKASLQTHIKLRHEETDRREMCYVCGKLVPVGTFTIHLETHKDRTVTCSKCNKVFANKIILERHIAHKHTDSGSTTKYFCKICNKALGSKGTLSTHMRITHSEAKKIECHICGKAYKLVSHVNVHIKSAHMDIRPHVCQTCTKAFHSKSELKNHMRTHTGERPFPCYICGKAFGFKTVLKTHMKVHSK